MATVSNSTTQNSTNSAVQSLYKSSGADASTGTDKSSSSASEQSDKFLKLLVAQMSNQDPLNPLDNSQVTSQMAQISTVEGIEKLNSTMGKFADANSTAKASNATGLIGQSVLTSGTTVNWTGDTTSVRGGVTIDAAASKVVVQLVNSAGKAVDSKTFTDQPAGTISFQWTGKDPQGIAYGNGAYKMVATAMGDGKVNATTLTTSQVVGVTQAGTGVSAQLANGTLVATDDIKGVFKP